MKRMMRWVAGAAVGGGGALALCAGLIVADGLTDDLRRGDVAVVLGSKVNPDGTPSPRLQARLGRALELYRDGWTPRILVSGGTGVEGVPEGTAMKRWLVSQGVARGRGHRRRSGHRHPRHRPQRRRRHARP